MKKCILISLILCVQQGWSQTIDFSLPRKISPAVSEIDILGQCEQGLIVMEKLKSQFSISAFGSTLSPIWKKNLGLKSKDAVIQKLILLPDSILVFYTESKKGSFVLKCSVFSHRGEEGNHVIVLDSFSHFFLSSIPELHYYILPQQSYVGIYYEDAYYSDSKTVHYIRIDVKENKIVRNSFNLNTFKAPVITEAVLTGQKDFFFMAGENTAKNMNNDFPFEKLLLLHVSSTDSVTQTGFEKSASLFSYPVIKSDEKNGNIIVCGLYAYNPGSESNGFFSAGYDLLHDTIRKPLFTDFSQSFISNYTGNYPPKKSDALLNFNAKNLIVKQDGGFIFIAESVSISTESFNNPGYGNFGVGTSLTVNYYHFDDIMAISMNKAGEMEWNSILRKKQQTEADGGYYSSFATFVGAGQIYFIYNDMLNGQTSVSQYSLSALGGQDRHELFSADRKGVMVIPRDAKQVSLNELVLPSLKRNYFQIVKITF